MLLLLYLNKRLYDNKYNNNTIKSFRDFKACSCLGSSIFDSNTILKVSKYK